MNQNNLYPQFPLYIPSKGRADICLTSKALTEMKVKHYVVVEPQEIQQYKKYISSFGQILELNLEYKKKYELCDDLGLSKSTGPGPARNFIWDHSIKNGFKYHWVMDDNIKYFARMYKNKRIKIISPMFWRAMEDFCLRYENVAMAGPCYLMFAFRQHGMEKMPPFILNTRIYSCNFIKNDVHFRWRGRYNEDTILSLDMLKAGYCTVQFYAFLQNKLKTQLLKGGNSEEFYFKEGTENKSKMLLNIHPDVTKVIYRFGRIHHHVNYNQFRENKLKKKRNLIIEKEKFKLIMKKVII